jgi:outer membrane lipoprotein LolB
MFRLPDCSLALCAAALLLAGCATMRAPRTMLAPEAQEAALRELDTFFLKGRANIRAGDESTTASLDWRQDAEAATFRLWGPIGAGRLTIDWRPGRLRLSTSRGQVFEGADAERVLLDELGFVPPFDALRYWVLGLEAPGDAATERNVAESGRIGELAQQQWRIRYNRWVDVSAEAGGVQLPRLLTVTRDDLRLRVVVERWKL